jgi:hypothetical protein
MDFTADGSEGYSTILLGMKLLPATHSHLPMKRMLESHIFIWHSPSIRFFEGKALSMHWRATFSTIDGFTIQDAITAQTNNSGTG